MLPGGGGAGELRTGGGGFFPLPFPVPTEGAAPVEDDGNGGGIE